MESHITTFDLKRFSQREYWDWLRYLHYDHWSTSFPKGLPLEELIKGVQTDIEMKRYRRSAIHNLLYQGDLSSIVHPDSGAVTCLNIALLFGFSLQNDLLPYDSGYFLYRPPFTPSAPDNPHVGILLIGESSCEIHYVGRDQKSQKHTIQVIPTDSIDPNMEYIEVSDEGTSQLLWEFLRGVFIYHGIQLPNAEFKT